MNKRKQSMAVRFGPAIKVVLFCLVTCGSGLGYVWQKHQITHLGREIKKREQGLSNVKYENKLDSHALSQLRSPQLLDRRARQLQLGLEMPRPEQIVVLEENRQSLSTWRSEKEQQTAAKVSLKARH